MHMMMTSFDAVRQRIPATVLVSHKYVLVGYSIRSATNYHVLVNQDNVWAYAMILSGCFMVFVGILVGILKNFTMSAVLGTGHSHGYGSSSLCKLNIDHFDFTD